MSDSQRAVVAELKATLGKSFESFYFYLVDEKDEYPPWKVAGMFKDVGISAIQVRCWREFLRMSHYSPHPELKRFYQPLRCVYVQGIQSESENRCMDLDCA